MFVHKWLSKKPEPYNLVPSKITWLFKPGINCQFGTNLELTASINKLILNSKGVINYLGGYWNIPLKKALMNLGYPTNCEVGYLACLKYHSYSQLILSQKNYSLFVNVSNCPSDSVLPTLASYYLIPPPTTLLSHVFCLSPLPSVIFLNFYVLTFLKQGPETFIHSSSCCWNTIYTSSSQTFLHQDPLFRKTILRTHPKWCH